MATSEHEQDEQQPIWVQDLLAWLAKIESLNDGEQQIEALEELLAELLPTKLELLPQVLDAARGIEDVWSRAYALIAVMTYTEFDRLGSLQEALQITSELEEGEFFPSEAQATEAYPIVKTKMRLN